MTRDEIIQALASASSFEEQVSLVAALDAQDDGIRSTAAAERSIDWADTVVRETLTPRRTLDRHTASSDWLADLETAPANHHTAIIAEASLWFQKLDGDVKADAHEYSEQARGIARRTAGKYGEAAEEAAQAFVAYAAFLNRQVLAASGLPQVQQLVDSQENPGETPLPTDVFDNFAPPVHEINVGVDGTQTNSLAPGAQEAMSGSGAGGGRPSEHEDDQDPVSQPMYMPASGRTGSLATDMIGNPSVAIGYVRNLNEFLAAEKDKDDEPDDDADDLPFPGAAKPFEKSSAKAGGADPFGRGDRAAGGGVNPTPAAPKPRHTRPYPAEPSRVMPGPAVYVPHITTEAASGLDQIQQVVNPHEDPAPTSLPQDTMWPVDQWPEQDAGTGQPSRHDAVRKQADMYGGGDAPHAVPGGETPVGNSPGTTPPRANGGDFDKGMTEGRADAAAGEAPSFADASSHVSDYVRGYTEGFGQGGQQPITTPDVPASMGGDSGQAANSERVERSIERPLTMAGLTVSASLITKDITGDEDFKRGYHYARSWTPGQEIVATGSLGEEAGIYAGVTDNTVHQTAWVSAHHAMAAEFPELEARIQRHRRVTAQLLETRDDVLVKGLYVQAATSLDLDTMAPSTNSDPNGATPFQGPGTVPILRDAPGSPAEPGGASPYNGSEPLGAPVVPDPMIQDLSAQPQASPQDKLDVSGDNASMGKSPQSMAFRRKVQAAKLAKRQGNGSK